MVVIVAKRDKYYGKFGPRMIEATINTILKEINRLRVEVGLTERTKAEMLNALETEYKSLPDYDFDKEPLPLEDQ